MADLVSTVEAANILGCSETLVRKRVTSGVLPAEKVQGKWRIRREDLDKQPRPHSDSSHPDTAPPPHHPRTTLSSASTPPPHHQPAPQHHAEWRDDLLAQVARLEASETTLRDEAVRREEDLRSEMERRDTASAGREESSKARVVDLERELTVRDSRIADLVEQNQILEAKVREVLESGKDEALQLANRIADLVSAHEDIQARVVELQPVAEKVPMLQAAVEERDATLSEQQSALQRSEEKLNAIQEDIDAIASRPVTGPVFRMLTKRKLRR